jgi:hypothetical protein
MIHRDTMIATPETLYLADAASCKLLDAATGEVKDEIRAPEDLSDGPVWKLPAGVVAWGLAIDRRGQVLLALRDGRVVCFGTRRTRNGKQRRAQEGCAKACVAELRLARRASEEAAEDPGQR